MLKIHISLKIQYLIKNLNFQKKILASNDNENPLINVNF